MNAKESFLCQIGLYLCERIPRGFNAHLSCLFNCGELEALFKCWLDRPSSADKAHTSTVVNVSPLEVEKITDHAVMCFYLGVDKVSLS